MKGFRVQGHFQMGMQPRQSFTLEVAAPDEAAARERILSRLGSKHGAPRRTIHIDRIENPDPEEIIDPVVRHQLALTKKQR